LLSLPKKKRADTAPNDSGARRRNRRTIGASGHEKLGIAESAAVAFWKNELVIHRRDERETKRTTGAALSILRFHRLVMTTIVDLAHVVCRIRATTTLLFVMSGEFALRRQRQNSDRYRQRDQDKRAKHDHDAGVYVANARASRRRLVELDAYDFCSNFMK
jgi:hypothetical protein